MNPFNCKNSAFSGFQVIFELFNFFYCIFMKQVLPSYGCFLKLFHFLVIVVSSKNGSKPTRLLSTVDYQPFDQTNPNPILCLFLTNDSSQVDYSGGVWIKKDEDEDEV